MPFITDLSAWSSAVDAWLGEFNADLEAVCHRESDAAWNVSVEITDANQEELVQAQRFK